MKMKDMEVLKLVKDYLREAGYYNSVVDSMTTEETTEKWEIRVTAHRFDNLYAIKLLIVDDATQKIIKFSDVAPILYEVAPQKKNGSP